MVGVVILYGRCGHVVCKECNLLFYIRFLIGRTVRIMPVSCVQYLASWTRADVCDRKV